MSDLSFLAPPDEVLDWRRVVLTGTAIRNGLLERLPGTAEAIAEASGLDDHSVRVLLDGLAVWDVVERRDGTYLAGSAFPDDSEAAALNQHALFIQRWSGQLDDRLVERRIENHEPRPPGALASWLLALERHAKERSPTLIDECLSYFPDTKSVLDVAGGHGEYGIEAARRGLTVTMLDVPEVVDVVSDWESVRRAGIEVVAGDAYEPLSDDRFDLVLCFGFTHTQPAEDLGALFANLAEMTAPGGGIAVHTFLRDAGPIPSLFAVQMLLTGRGGDSHSRADYERWLAAAGFDEPKVVELNDRALLLARKP